MRFAKLQISEVVKPRKTKTKGKKEHMFADSDAI
jgi:hypothetical protein